MARKNRQNMAKAWDKATAHVYEKQRKEQAERDRLNEAAPDLLAACKLFAAYDDNDGPRDDVDAMFRYDAANKAIRAAIAKAQPSS